MSQDAPQHIRFRRLLDTMVIGFVSPYLQTEDLIEKTGAEIFNLVEAEQPAKVVLSFDGVRFVSSSMLAQVVKLHKRMAKAKGKLRVCSLAPPIKEVLHASQLDRLIDIQPDETAALANFK